MKKAFLLDRSLLLSLCFLLFIPAMLLSQASVSDGTGATDPRIDKCSRDGVETITVQFLSATTDATIDLGLPSGVEYICGSVTATGGTGSIADAMVCDPSAPTLEVTGTFSPGNSITFTVGLAADCSATAGSNQFTVSVSNAGTNDCAPCDDPLDFQVLEASLQVQLAGGFAHPTQTGLIVGSTGSVNINLVNLGQGCVDSLTFCIDDPDAFISTTSLMLGATTLTGTTNGTQTCYTIQASDDPANFGGDGLLCNTESISLTRAYEVVGCPTTGVSIVNNYTVNYGCTPVDTDCQTTSGEGTGNFALDFGQPQLSVAAAVFQQGSLCTDHIIDFTYTNDGNGAAAASIAYDLFQTFGLSTQPNAPNQAEDFDITNIELVTGDGSTTTALSYSGGTFGTRPEIDYSTFTSDPNAFGGGLSDEDDDGQFDDLAVGDSYTIRITYTFVCRDVCDLTADPGSDNPVTAILYEDQCGNDLSFGNRNGIFVSSRSGGLLGEAVTPFNVADGESGSAIVDFQFGFPTDQFLTCNAPNNTLEISYELPTGITLAAMPNSTINGNSVTPTLNSGTADTVVLETVFTGAFGPVNYNASFDFTVDCGLVTSTRIPYQVNYLCDGCDDCAIPIVCDTLDLSINCQGPCPEGGLTTVFTNTERTSLGFTDASQTTEIDPTTATELQLKRLLPGDTAKITMAAIQFFGTNVPTAPNTAFVELVYDLLGGDRVYEYIDGTFTHYDASAMTTSSSAALPAPTNNVDVGGQHLLHWDLAPQLPGAVIDVGDSLILCINVKVLNNSSLSTASSLLPGGRVNSFNLASSTGDPLPGGEDRYSCGGLPIESYVNTQTESGFLILRPGLGCDQGNIDWRLNASFGGNDLYPDEIRYIYRVDSVVFDLGATGLVLDPSRSPDIRTVSTFSTPTNITPDREMGTEIAFINGGNTDWGNGNSHRVNLYVLPNCASQSGTITATYYYSRFVQNLDYTGPCVEQDVKTNALTWTTTQPTFQIVNQTGTKIGDEKTECFELTVRNTTTNADGRFIFLEFEDAMADMQIESITHVSTGATMVDTALTLLPAMDGQWVQLAADFPATQVVTLEVCATYNNCVSPSVVINQGFDCAGYPSDPNDLFETLACTPSTETLNINPVNAVVQGQLTLQEGISDICETHTYELLVTSAGAADLIDPSVLIDLPTGLTFVNAEIAYPYDSSLDDPSGYTGTFEAATSNFSVTMDSVTIVLGDNSMISDSLPGSNTEQTGQGTIEDRQAVVRFNFISDCDFVSASRIPFQINGFDPCGDALTPTNLLSAPLVLNGVTEELDVAIALTLPDSEIDCGSTTIAPDLTYIDTNSDGNPYVTGATDTVRVTLPAGVMYVTSSYIPDDANAPTFAGVEMDGASQVLILEVPSGVSVPDLGSVMTGFEFDVTLDLSSSTCGMSGDLAINYEQTLGALFCTTIGMNCMEGAKTNLGSNFTTLSFQKSEVTNLLITSSSAVEIMGTFDLAGADLPMGESITLEAFCADDLMMTTPIGSAIINGPITSGANVPYTISITSSCAPGMEGYVAAGPTNSGGADQCVCDAIVSMDVVLPVELITFKGYSKDCATELQWQTASETNNAYFEVEYSEDAKTFKVLERIIGAGTSLVVQNYSYTHENGLATTAYYRLKQVDFDGTATYSEVITVESDCEAAQQLEVYPIPVGQGQELQVRYYNEQENANLQIFDVNGRMVKRIPSISKGWNQIALDISELSNGVYYLVSDTGMAQRFVVVE